MCRQIRVGHGIMFDTQTLWAEGRVVLCGFVTSPITGGFECGSDREISETRDIKKLLSLFRLWCP